LLIQRLCKRWLLAVEVSPLFSVSLRLVRGLVLLALLLLTTLSLQVVVVEEITSAAVEVRAVIVQAQV
jgi:hypothetical protein